jgi:SAM-dependent methyltransferase
MYTESAELYDLIYSGFKNYGAEAAEIAALLHTVHPGCKTVLDVACGTAEHARLLATTHGFVVDGLDLDPQFVQIARKKHPAGQIVQADMGDFQLPQRYDAIVCLFSSIGYLGTLDRVTCALRCFRQHLAPGGVIIVEPWFAPGILDPNRVTSNIGETRDLRVERTAHIEIAGAISRIHFDYVITDASGVRKTSEIHELGLFTTEEMLQSFKAAGLDVRHDPKGLTGRGLYIARIAA